jgi:outer membrane protein assembly factor BamE
MTQLTGIREVNYDSRFPMVWIPRPPRIVGGRNGSLMKRLSLLLPLLLSACMLAPHKMEIQQGNFVDQDTVAKLKLGMTRSQVRFLLGTPLVTDVFHPQRWDYVYLKGRAGDVRTRARVAVIFEGDKLIRVDTEPEDKKKLSLAPTQTGTP